MDFGGRAVFGFDAIQDGNGMTDCHGHGTHVAGTVGGATYGVAKAVRLHAVRVLDCTGSGLISQVIAGVNWVTSHRIKPAVANMSLGGGFSQALNTAVANSIKAGVSYTIAAGNSNLDACTVSPASTPAAITVAASDSNDVRASFSNLGTCVDLFGPGVAIKSDWNASNTATMVLSGTSMAAPHAAGCGGALSPDPPDGHAGQRPVCSGQHRYRGPHRQRRNRDAEPAALHRAVRYHSGQLAAARQVRLHLHRSGMRLRREVLSGRSRSRFTELGLRRRDQRLGHPAASQLCRRGTITARLTVQDASGLTSSLTKTFTLPAAGGRAGNPPVANFIAFPSGGTVEYDASSSTDDVGIGSYKWDFGDGKSGSGKLVTHVYSAPNQFYTVTLTVFDLAGQSSQKSFQVFPNSH